MPGDRIDVVFERGLLGNRTGYVELHEELMSVSGDDRDIKLNPHQIDFIQITTPSARRLRQYVLVGLGVLFLVASFGDATEFVPFALVLIGLGMLDWAYRYWRMTPEAMISTTGHEITFAVQDEADAGRINRWWGRILDRPGDLTQDA